MIFEKLFFKKRHILSTNNVNNLNTSFELQPSYKFNIIDNFDLLSEHAKISESSLFLRHKKLFKKRLNKEDWTLFVIIDSKAQELTAYYWALTGNKNVKWHDNFLIPENSALLCNAYVSKKYRNQGLYKYLIIKAHFYLASQNIKNIFTIVEKSNSSSLKANLSTGLKISGTNYLIKFLGINLLSINKIFSKEKNILTGLLLGKKRLYKKTEV